MYLLSFSMKCPSWILEKWPLLSKVLSSFSFSHTTAVMCLDSNNTVLFALFTERSTILCKMAYSAEKTRCTMAGLSLKVVGQMISFIFFSLEGLRFSTAWIVTLLDSVGCQLFKSVAWCSHFKELCIAVKSKSFIFEFMKSCKLVFTSAYPPKNYIQQCFQWKKWFKYVSLRLWLLLPKNGFFCAETI